MLEENYEQVEDEQTGVALLFNTKRKRQQKKCLVCKEKFYYTNTNQKFCSENCKRAHYKKILDNKNGRGLEQKKCPVCETVFIPKTRAKKTVFCSDKCNRVAREKIRVYHPLVREYFLERANFSCEQCGVTNKKLECHHIIPLCKGGGDNVENIRVLCDKCHQKAHNLTSKEFFGKHSGV